MSADFHVVIPARFASTRLPGKMLKDIQGRPMIWHVVERARESGARSVYVATDDGRIADALQGSDCEVIMTAQEHTSGTERLAEACRRIEFDDSDIVVNVQGDEPLIPPSLIRQSARALAADDDASIATLCHRIERVEDLLDPNVVKVVFDAQGRALWFSRAPIPYERDGFEAGFGQPGHAAHWRHLGLYAYSARAIREYVALPPSAEERSEMLEQLRALYHGWTIVVEEAVERPGPGIDTEQDLAKVRAQLAAAGDAAPGQIDSGRRPLT